MLNAKQRQISQMLELADQANAAVPSRRIRDRNANEIIDLKRLLVQFEEAIRIVTSRNFDFTDDDFLYDLVIP